MPVVHHFAHGPVNPAVAYLLAFLGALMGLACTARARAATTRSRRARWLVIASFSIGGGIWLMHFTAMLGFDIPDSPVRYEPRTTTVSALLAVAVVGVGLALVGTGRRAVWKILLGGALTGTGVATMHYTGMAAMRIAGTVTYDRGVVIASVLIAIAAATVALWLSVTVRGFGPILFSAAIMAVAVCGMHYTGMAAMHVDLRMDGNPVAGLDPITLTLPIVIVTTGSLAGLFFGALQTVTEEDFAQAPRPPRGQPRHAPAQHAPAQHAPAQRHVPAQPAQPHPVSLRAFSATVPVPISSKVASHDGRG